MSVYVDPLMAWGGSATFRWQESCHLVADSDEELHAFAATLGLRRAWHQPYPRHRVSHYDLTKAQRARAVRLGAIEVALDFRPVRMGVIVYDD